MSPVISGPLPLNHAHGDNTAIKLIRQMITLQTSASFATCQKPDVDTIRCYNSIYKIHSSSGLIRNFIKRQIKKIRCMAYFIMHISHIRTETIEQNGWCDRFKLLHRSLSPNQQQQQHQRKDNILDIHGQECSSDFTFPWQGRHTCSLQLLIQPSIVNAISCLFCSNRRVRNFKSIMTWGASLLEKDKLLQLVHWYCTL